MSKPKAYGFWTHPIYYTKKGEANVKNEFKVGDLVFEVSFVNGIGLTETTACGHPTYSIRGSSGVYTTNGLDYEDGKTPSLLPATPEIRQALVTLYGEDAVPKLPVRGSELTKKLLEKQKYVLCLVSRISDDEARSNDSPRVYVVSGTIADYFDLTDGSVANFAVPIDEDGNEITDYEE